MKYLFSVQQQAVIVMPPCIPPLFQFFVSRLHYMASTNCGLCQGNMSWCYRVRGPSYHWVVDLYEWLNLPVLHQRCTALHKSCLSTVWLRVAIFSHLYGSAPAALSVATAALTQSQKCTPAANGKQRSCNLSAALVAALISR